MSYRELRNFTEMLRVLGYPRLVSIENFRRPNFPLVAEILQWLVVRFDPTLELLVDIETEQDRVIFIKTAAQLMATKAHIKLNTKKLYMSDVYSVQELLKISSLLYKAARSSQHSEDADDGGQMAVNLSDATIISKVNELKKSRLLASEITRRGANLYDLLAKEIEMREQRAAVLSRQLEVTDIEKCLREAVKGVEKEMEESNYKIENVASDEANLDAKIEKKKAELERHQKRLMTLKSVRPAFMDEYEKLEEELGYIYDMYILKFRCLVFLEQQLEEVEKSELEQKHEREEQIRKMVEAMKEEEILRGETNGNDEVDVPLAEDEEEEKDVDEDEDKLINGNDRLRRSMINTTTASKRSATGRVRVFGSTLAGEKDESLDSDLDLEGDEDASDLDSEDEMELMNLTVGNDERKAPDTDLTAKGQQDHESDNDF